MPGRLPDFEFQSSALSEITSPLHDLQSAHVHWDSRRSSLGLESWVHALPNITKLTLHVSRSRALSWHRTVDLSNSLPHLSSLTMQGGCPEVRNGNATESSSPALFPQLKSFTMATVVRASEVLSFLKCVPRSLSRLTLPFRALGSPFMKKLGHLFPELEELSCQTGVYKVRTLAQSFAVLMEGTQNMSCVLRYNCLLTLPFSL